MYWGDDLVPLPAYRVEGQRPHLQPRRPQRHDSGNVAATAYALRLYAARGEAFLTPSIVRWLQSQRGHDGGWMSTQVCHLFLTLSIVKPHLNHCWAYNNVIYQHIIVSA